MHPDRSARVDRINAMHCRTSFHAAVLLLATLPSLVAGASVPLCDVNGSGRTYKAGSAFEENLFSLMRDLEAYSSSSPTLFGASSSGAAPNAAYGFMLCRGNVSASACYVCGTRVFDNIEASCNRSRDVSYYDDECYVRLSDTSFDTSASNAGGMFFHRGQSIDSSNVTGYARAVTDLLRATVGYAVENSTRMFATGKWTGTDPGFPHIFSVAQCMPDLSPALCRSCLEEFIAQWGIEFNLNETGAGMASRQCILRSDAQTTLYTGEAMVRLPIQLAPAPAAPARKKSCVAVVVGVLAILLLLALCMWKRTLHRLGAIARPRPFKYWQLYRATKGFAAENKIGKGAFGEVYKGTLKDDKGNAHQVAVKKLKNSSGKSSDFTAELTTIGQISHGNLVRLEGWCCSKMGWNNLINFMCWCCNRQNFKLYLVYELVPKGNLSDNLHREDGQVMPWKMRYRIVEGILSGLHYLHHGCDPYILHRDIKPANVLLDDNFQAKLGDFGLSIVAQANETSLMATAMGTRYYMDPLCMKDGKVKFRRSSDIYSFGLVLLEIANGQNNRDLVRQKYADEPATFTESAADPRLRGEFDKMQMERVIVLGLRCSDPDELQRPSTTGAMQFLKEGVLNPATDSMAMSSTSEEEALM